MSISEFRYWQAEYEIETFGEKRADMRAALVAYTIARTRSDSPDIKMSSFMLNFDEPTPKTEMTDEELIRAADAMTRMFGGSFE